MWDHCVHLFFGFEWGREPVVAIRKGFDQANAGFSAEGILKHKAAAATATVSRHLIQNMVRAK